MSGAAMCSRSEAFARCVAVWLLVLASLAAGALPSIAADKDDLAITPQALSPAEKAAVSLALAFLDQGPKAWLPHLAAGSALSKLSAEDAIAEIGVRTGPAAGAEWQLQTPGTGHPAGEVVFAIDFPSGLEEALVLQMVDQGGWKVDSVKSMSDPREVPDADILAATTGAGSRLSGLRGGWGPCAFLLLVGLLLATSRRGPSWRPRLSTLLVLGMLLPLLACHDDGRGVTEKGAAPSPANGLVRLGALRPLRRALATGGVDEIERQFASAPKEGPLVKVVSLWKAAYLVQQMKLHEAEMIISSFPSPSSYPLAELLRARLAFIHGDETETPLHFERVLRQVDYDGMRLEAAQALELLGFRDKAEVAFTQLGEMGTRTAQVYYALAALSVVDQEEARGEGYFRTAWKLLPVEREDLFGDALVATLCTRENLFALMDFGSETEPAIGHPKDDREPLKLPSGARASLTGELLRITMGSAHLLVPGGGLLAPPETPIESARALHDELAKEAVDHLPSLEEQARAAGPAAQPGLRRRIHAAAAALAHERRWKDLLDLTSGIGSDVEHVTPGLVQLRARALSESQRDDEATGLLVALAQSDRANRRPDPSTFYQLAEILVAKGKYDLAIRLLERANQVSPLEISDVRIRQVRMEKRLAADNRVYRSKHFAIRHPRVTGDQQVEHLAWVLEQERQRLQRWIPLSNDSVVDVDLYPVREFLYNFSGGLSVVGLFDGRVRVPFADLPSLRPELVSILSHELAHAMITERTHDQAPKWFQEGLAQHVQMVQDVVNPAPDLLAKSRILSFPVVESVLEGFAEPQFVEIAYGEAAWAVHFIEATRGVAGIHRLLDAFAEGKDTEGALEQALGLTVGEFDQAYWRWSKSQAPKLWPTHVRRYDREVEKARLTADKRDDRLPEVGRARAAGNAAVSGAGAMQAWYRVYAARSASVKQALAPVLQALNGDTSIELGTRCSDLERRAREFLAAPEVLDCPDAHTSWRLRKAYEALRKLGAACRMGQDSVARAQLSVAQQELGNAAKSLASFGLRP